VSRKGRERVDTLATSAAARFDRNDIRADIRAMTTSSTCHRPQTVFRTGQEFDVLPDPGDVFAVDSRGEHHSSPPSVPVDPVHDWTTYDGWPGLDGDDSRTGEASSGLHLRPGDGLQRYPGRPAAQPTGPGAAQMPARAR